MEDLAGMSYISFLGTTETSFLSNENLGQDGSNNRQPKRGRKRTPENVTLEDFDNWEMDELSDDSDTDNDYDVSSCDEIEKKDEAIVRNLDEEEEEEEQRQQEENTIRIEDLDKDNSSSVIPDKSKKKKECFACRWSKTEEAGLDLNRVNQMIFMIESNFASTKTSFLARAVHLFFLNKIYIPMRQKYGPNAIGMWRTKDIIKHIKYHLLEPRYFVGNEIRKLQKFRKVLQKNMAMKRFDVKFINQSYMRMHMEAGRRILDLYRTNITGLNFYDPTCKIDCQQIAKIVNKNKHFNYV